VNENDQYMYVITTILQSMTYCDHQLNKERFVLIGYYVIPIETKECGDCKGVYTGIGNHE